MEVWKLLYTILGQTYVTRISQHLWNTNQWIAYQQNLGQTFVTRISQHLWNTNLWIAYQQNLGQTSVTRISQHSWNTNLWIANQQNLGQTSVTRISQHLWNYNLLVAYPVFTYKCKCYTVSIGRNSLSVRSTVYRPKYELFMSNWYPNHPLLYYVLGAHFPIRVAG